MTEPVNINAVPKLNLGLQETDEVFISRGGSGPYRVPASSFPWEQKGDKGDPGGSWAPVLSLVTDGVRLVHRVVDWVGGTGEKPAALGYVGAAGFVTAAADAVDLRGVAGVRGWSPVLAVVEDGVRRVQQVVDWTGGAGTKPTTLGYVGATGLVDTAAAAVDVRGAQGGAGWAPVLAVVADGERRVQQIVDWTDGAGTKPTSLGYVGAAGIVATAAAAMDVRGAQGVAGWAPMLAVVADGERRVQRVVDWTGGAGTKPATLGYVGAAGIVATAAAAVDVRGPQGVAGWAPVLSVVEDGVRRVHQVVDWVGGAGTKPDSLGYVGAAGIVATAAEAVDVRGPLGTVSATSIREALIVAQPSTKADIGSLLSQARTGATLAARLDNLQSVTIQAVGDSTTNDIGDCIYEIASQIAAKYPEYRVEHALWSDATQSYSTPTVLQPGSTTPYIAFSDTFTTGSGEVFGRTPDVVGSAWGRDGTNVLGDFTVGGGVMTRTNDVVSASLIIPIGAAGDVSVAFDFASYSTVPDASSARSFGAYVKYVDTNNHIEARVTINTSGTVQCQIVKRIAAVVGVVASVTSPVGVVLNTAGQTGVFTVDQVGTLISLKLGSVVLVSGSVLASDLSALAAATSAGLYMTVGTAGVAWAGSQITSVSATVTPTVGTTQTVRINNAGMPGATLSYHSDATRYPLIVLPADVLLVTCSHNYTGMLGASYAPILQEFIRKVIASQPVIDVIVAATNPVKGPISWDGASASRDAHMRVMAEQSGYGFVPIRQGFLKTPAWQSLIASDGLHPTSSGAGSGGQKWRDIFWAWLCGKQYMPRA